MFIKFFNWKWRHSRTVVLRVIWSRYLRYMCYLSMCTNCCLGFSWSIMMKQSLVVVHVSVIMNASPLACSWLNMHWMLIAWSHYISLILWHYHLSLPMVSIIKLSNISNELLSWVSKRIIHWILPLVFFSSKNLAHSSTLPFLRNETTLNAAFMMQSDSFRWWWTMSSDPISASKSFLLRLIILSSSYFSLLSTMIMLLTWD